MLSYRLCTLLITCATLARGDHGHCTTYNTNDADNDVKGYIVGMRCETMNDECNGFVITTCDWLMVGRKKHMFLKVGDSRLARESFTLPRVTSVKGLDSGICPKHTAVCQLACQEAAGEECANIIVTCCPVYDDMRRMLFWQKEDHHNSQWVTRIATNRGEIADGHFSYCTTDLERGEIVIGVECQVTTPLAKNCGRFRTVCQKFVSELQMANPKPNFGIADSSRLVGFWKRVCTHVRHATESCKGTVKGIETINNVLAWTNAEVDSFVTAGENGLRFERSKSFGDESTDNIDPSPGVKFGYTQPAPPTFFTTRKMSAAAGKKEMKEAGGEEKENLVNSALVNELIARMGLLVYRKTVGEEPCTMDTSEVVCPANRNVVVYQWTMKIGVFRSTICEFAVTCGLPPLCLPGCCADADCQECDSERPDCNHEDAVRSPEAASAALERGTTLTCNVNFHDGTDGMEPGKVEEYTTTGCFTCLYNEHSGDRMCKRDGSLLCGMSLANEQSMPSSGECSALFGSHMCCCNDKDMCSGGVKVEQSSATSTTITGSTLVTIADQQDDVEGEATVTTTMPNEKGCASFVIFSSGFMNVLVLLILCVN